MTFVLTRPEARRRRTLALAFADKHGIPHPGLVRTPPLTPPYLRRPFRAFVERLHLYLRHNGHPHLVVTNGFDTPFVKLITPPLPRLDYADPFRAVQRFVWNGHDHGIDIAGHGPIYAIGPGVVTVVNDSSAWIGGKALGYEITEGPAKGLQVYVAENVRGSATESGAPLSRLIHVGQHVTSQTILCYLHDAYPWMESGWALPGTDTYYPADRNTSPWGLDFERFVSLLPNSRVPGTPRPLGLPTNWPHWS